MLKPKEMDACGLVLLELLVELVHTEVSVLWSFPGAKWQQPRVLGMKAVGPP